MRIKLMFIALSAAMLLTCDAYAAGLSGGGSGEDTATVNITDVTPRGDAGGQAAIPDIFPQSVETRIEGGVELLVKTYELPYGEDPGVIAAEKTERGGIGYILRDITRRDTEPVIDVKSVTQDVTVTSPSDKTEDILPLLKKSLAWDSDGYSGELLLDESSITAEAADTVSYSYTLKEAREYFGLARNDPALLPKTVVENGLTYRLADVQWSGVSENATVVYTALATGQKPDGYAVTALYAGDVTRTEAGNAIYTLIYEPVPAPLVAEPPVDWGRVLWVVIPVLGAVALTAGFVLMHRKYGIFKRKRHPSSDPETRPARRKPHALEYMKRDETAENGGQKNT